MKQMILTLSLLLTTIGVKAQETTIELTPLNTVVLRGEVNSQSVADIKQKLVYLSKQRGAFSKAPIYLVIQSPGGSIFDGLDLIDTIKSIPNVHTITYFAASMASAIVQQTPGLRLGKGSAISMFHRAAGGVQGVFETGNLETRLDMFKRVVRDMERKNASRMGISLESYKEKVREELWIFGNENIQQKALDKTVGVTCSKELIEKKEKVTFATMFGNMNVIFSGCPELRNLTEGADDNSKKLLQTNAGRNALKDSLLGVFKGMIQ